MGDFDGFTFTPAELWGISMAALELIVSEEDGDQKYYVKHEAHWDWPGGSSGPTIMIGVDCGYMTPSDVRRNLAGIVDEARIALVVEACGRRGQAAREWVAAHHNEVTFTWRESVTEFVRRELPEWVAHVEQAIPGTGRLPPDCKGAIVSLAYNRGASFNAPGAHFREMRQIRADVMAGNLADVPRQFESMRRLWPQGGDLWRRRDHEAALFTKGLLGTPPAAPISESAPKAPVSPAPGSPIGQTAAAAPSPLPAGNATHDLAWVQGRLNLHGAEPQLFVDGVPGPMTRTAIEWFQRRHGLLVDGVAGPNTIARLGIDP